MRSFTTRHRLIVTLLLAALLGAALIARTMPIESAAVTHTAATPAITATHTTVSVTHAPPTAAIDPTHAPAQIAPEPMHTPTAIPTVALPTATPEPTAVPVPRVGIQVGHWQSAELPEELARLRSNTGAVAAGVREVDVNLEVAQRVVSLLEAQGIAADLLPATVPPRYQADAFVSIHADGSASAASRGFKIATPWRTSLASQALHDALVAEYAAATGLPQDGAITFNMRGYYAFSSRRFVHAIDRLTPAVIVETGFLTNSADRAMLTGDPDRVARGIADGVLRYLSERDPADRAALVPPNIQTQRPAGDGADVRAAASADSSVIYRAHPNDRLVPFQQRGDWLQVFVRGRWNVLGWVHRSEVRDSGDPLPLGEG